MTASIRAIDQLGRFFEVLAGRCRALGALRILPWVSVGEQILQSEAVERKAALKALDELQITTNPTARTDALYATLREYLAPVALTGLFMLSLAAYDDELRRPKGRVRKPVVSMRVEVEL